MNEVLVNQITDLLCRIEGAIKINEQGNSLLVDRKLQGIKDKLVHMLEKEKNNTKEPQIVSIINETLNEHK